MSEAAVSEETALTPAIEVLPALPGKKGRPLKLTIGDLVRAGPYTGEIVEIVGDGVFIRDAGDGQVHGVPRLAVERVKRRGGKRVEGGLTDTGGALDDCQTPDPVALAICARLKEEGCKPLLVVEPSAGEGAFVRAAKATWPDAIIVAVEVRAIEPETLVASGADEVFIGRWEDVASSVRELIAAVGATNTLVVGNPPYRLAAEHALVALSPVGGQRVTLAFLLTIGFITTARRLKDFWNEQPGQTGEGDRYNGLSTLYPLAQRPYFMEKQGGGKKTDMREYGVFHWGKGGQALPMIGAPIWWRKGKDEDEVDADEGGEE